MEDALSLVFAQLDVPSRLACRAVHPDARTFVDAAQRRSSEVQLRAYLAAMRLYVPRVPLKWVWRYESPAVSERRYVCARCGLRTPRLLSCTRCRKYTRRAICRRALAGPVVVVCVVRLCRWWILRRDAARG